MMKESQMMATEKSAAGAPSTSLSWESIHWKAVKAHVRRLQMRIAKAVREGHHHKAKALQWLLTHSYNAKLLLAIRRVTQNPGKNTPGVDGIVWENVTAEDASSLGNKTSRIPAETIKENLYTKERRT